MEMIMLRRVLSRALFLAAATFIIAAEDVAKNLVVNGNFEEVKEGKPAKWVTGTSDGGKVEMTSSTEQPQEGKRCLRLRGSAEWVVAFSEKIPIDRKKSYTLTGYARAKSGTAYIKIDYYQGDKYLEAYTSSDEITSDKWTKLTVNSELDTHPDATHLLAVAVGVGEFDTYFDDFVMTAK
jgi:hypothetical protein